MDTTRVPRPSRLDKLFRLHIPTYRTTPPGCIVCGAPIVGLEEWLNSECPGAGAEQREAA